MTKPSLGPCVWIIVFRLNLLLPIVLLLGRSPQAHANDEPGQDGISPSTETTTSDTARPPRSDLSKSFAARGSSPRLFDMPVADVVGPYEVSLSYDGSLLEDPGLLSSAGVAALGIGDLGQVEYRHTSAIGLGGGSVPLPAVGVQFKLPFDGGPRMPALALAYRLGVDHEEQLDGISYTEKATDIFGVAHLVLPGSVHLHLGLRLTSASLKGQTVDGMREKAERTLVLPAIGASREVGPTSVIAEMGRAPLFEVDASGAPNVEHGITGRVGLRWRLHPRFSFDASAGYLARESGVSPNEILAWDMRLGGEIFVPWGALACNALSLFCN